MDLHAWIRTNGTRYQGRQIDFVSGDLRALVKGPVNVISTHTSKSVLLPVYSLEKPDRGLRLVLRNNFHNWKLSVLSQTPIEQDFSDLFHTTPPVDPDYTGNPLSPVYFEGFPQDLIFGYYSTSDHKQWSAEIWSDYALWTTVYLISKQLENLTPLRWGRRPI